MTRLKNVFHSMAALFLFVGMITMISCDSESDANNTTEFLNAEELRTLPMGNGTLQAGRHFHPSLGGQCLQLVYPVTLIFPDNSSQEVADNESLRATIRDWYQNNISEDRPTFAYPITILINDEERTVEDQNELTALFADCRSLGSADGRPGHHGRPGGHHLVNLFGDCLELTFPIQILLPDGTSLSIATQEELIQAFRDWKSSGSDSLGRPEFEFPITITVNDSAIVVNSSEELRAVAQLCRGDRGHGSPCFHFVFPISVLSPDGSVTPIADREALGQFIRQWRQGHPNSTVRPTLVFPLDIEYQDGTITSVNSEEEFDELKNACD